VAGNTVTHGKHRHNVVVAEDYEVLPHKRVRGEATGRTLEAVQSMTRTRHRPETRVPTIMNNASFLIFYHHVLSF
jgi:hypothetical protein